MTNEKLLELGDKTYTEDCRPLLKSKGHDYSGHDDTFRNLKNSQVVGVSTERGILVRMMDKISRLSQLLDKEAMVKSEKLEDTIHDIINYSILLKGVLHERQRVPSLRKRVSCRD